MTELKLIKDEVYHQCWDSIKSTVRTKILVSKETLQTERQWAEQGYVVDKPTAEYARGAYLWTNSNCSTRCLYLFDKEVRKGTEDELRKFFESERKRRNTLAKIRREEKKKERDKENKRKQPLMNAVDNLNFLNDELTQRLKEMIDTQYNSKEIVAILCREIIRQVNPLNTDIANVIVVDTETTGLDYTTNELLQVSIISDKREILYNSYIKPIQANSWIEAQRVNHISYDMVKDSPTILSECVKINNILNQADVIIGYNIDFDLDFLCSIGCQAKDSVVIIDVMKIFAEIYGEWNDFFEDYKWQSLQTCASYYKYEWQGNAHDSLADCFATLYCYEQIDNTNPGRA